VQLRVPSEFPSGTTEREECGPPNGYTVTGIRKVLESPEQNKTIHCVPIEAVRAKWSDTSLGTPVPSALVSILTIATYTSLVACKNKLIRNHKKFKMINVVPNT
jgi:hypothetical protein